MDEIGSEVSHKIRAAIKAKLIELGVYIDGELPDYIMVMVANKRSRHQMNEDLQLFLGVNTKAFTTWLYTVLQKLQEVTVANFDPKDIVLHKVEKRKYFDSGESDVIESISYDGENEVGKRYGKKFKKSKYKAKKEKDRITEDSQASTESTGYDEEKMSGEDEETGSSQDELADSLGESTDKVEENSEQNSSYSSVSIVPGKVDNSNAEASSAKSSSPSHYSDVYVKRKYKKESEEEDSSTEENGDGKMQDEFNIKPLKKTDDKSTNEELFDKPKFPTSESQSNSFGMIFKAPTRELLREHDKIISLRERRLLKLRKRSARRNCRDESAAREGIVEPVQEWSKQILPKSQMPDKKESHASDAEVLKTSSNSKENSTFSTHRAKRISQRRDHDVEEDENMYNRDSSSSNPLWEKSSPKDKNESENSRGAIPSTSEQKSNIISISKSLEMEKNLGFKSQEYKKSENKTTSGPKKSVSSTICTIPEPETPEISSVIKVKPREFMPKEKQANKALLLKAVADAEKSVATVHTRNDTDIEPKKSEGLFTKNLIGKGKRYEKLAVTLSNVKAGGNIADHANFVTQTALLPFCD